MCLSHSQIAQQHWQELWNEVAKLHSVVQSWSEIPYHLYSVFDSLSENCVVIGIVRRRGYAMVYKTICTHTRNEKSHVDILLHHFENNVQIIPWIFRSISVIGINSVCCSSTQLVYINALFHGLLNRGRGRVVESLSSGWTFDLNLFIFKI